MSRDESPLPEPDVPEPDVNVRDLIMGNPVARAFAITGDAWTQLILREAFYGARRFSTWRERLGIPRSVLVDRLTRLVSAGLFEQRPARSGERLEYRLTEAGLELFPIAIAMHGWAVRWLCPEGPPLDLIDTVSGRVIEGVVCDLRSGRPLDPRRIRWEMEAAPDRPGPASLP